MDIEQQYRESYPLFDGFTKRMELLLETILKESEIKYHLVESRTKSIESYCEKVSRKQGKYSNPIEDITDKSALRIIVYYIDDLAKISKVLDTNFQIDPDNSFDAKNNLSENQFGYLSSHYVIKLKSDRYKLPEWKAYKDFKAEIQVRTALQHAWAAISHELEYKKTYDIPSILKRKLFRLAGLIELADEEFQKAKEEHQTVELSIKEKKPLNNIELFNEINLNTIQLFFNDNQVELDKIEENATKAGFTIKNDHKDLVNKRNKFLSDIIEICELKEIQTIDQFREQFKFLSKFSLDNLTSIFKLDNTDWTVSKEFLVLLLMIVSLDKSQVVKYGGKGWGKQTWEKIENFVISKK